MKAKNFGFLLSFAVVATFAACAPTGSKGKINSKAAAPGSNKVGQNDKVDTKGFIQLSGAGIFNGEGDSLIAKLTNAIVMNDKDPKMTADISDTLKKELAEIAKAKTYMLLGCKEVPNHLQSSLKDSKEVKASESKDSVSHEAAVIILCGNASLPALATLKANAIYMQDSTLTAASRGGKLVVSTNYLYLSGTKNILNAPLKAGNETSIDLSVAVKILKIQGEGQLKINLNSGTTKQVSDENHPTGIVGEEGLDLDADKIKGDAKEEVQSEEKKDETKDKEQKDPDADGDEQL